MGLFRSIPTHVGPLWRALVGVKWGPLHSCTIQVCFPPNSFVLSCPHLGIITFLYTKQLWCGYDSPDHIGLEELTFIQNEYLYAKKHWIIWTSHVVLIASVEYKTCLIRGTLTQFICQANVNIFNNQTSNTQKGVHYMFIMFSFVCD